MPRIALKELETDRTQTVADTEATVGRDPACVFVIGGPKSTVVSGRHARIFFQDSAWWVQDTSRNGTVLDEERLQAGQRHALKVGQIIGLGETGPRFRVIALESRMVAETMVEPPPPPPPSPPAAPAAGSAALSPKTTAPRQRPMLGGSESGAGLEAQTSAMRKSEAQRAGVKFEEPTEPKSPARDWAVHVVLRAAHSDQRFEARTMVVRLGRSPECEVRIAPEQGASVSRVHAEIAVEQGGVVIRDAGSRNGTFVNGIRMQSAHHAAAGDQIMLGAGGPTLVIDDLHIVKGPKSPSAPRGGARAGIGGGPTPPDASPSTPRSAAASPILEPPTAPPASTRVVGPGTTFGLPRGAQGASPAARFSGAGRLLEDVLADVPRKSASRIRLLVWVGMGILLILVAALLGRLSAP